MICTLTIEHNQYRNSDQLQPSLYPTIQHGSFPPTHDTMSRTKPCPPPDPVVGPHFRADEPGGKGNLEEAFRRRSSCFWSVRFSAICRVVATPYILRRRE